MKKRRRTGRMSRLLGIPIVLFAMAGWCLIRALQRGAAEVPAFFLLLAGTLLCTLLPALAGLFGISGFRQQEMTDSIPGADMLRRDVFCGALFLCPYTLLRDIIRQLMGAEDVCAVMDPALFFPYFMLYVLLVPAAEALYYRVWLEKRFLSGYGGWAAAAAAVCFAIGGYDLSLFLPRLSLALMLSVCMRKHDSVISSLIVHSSFMISLLFSWGLGIFGGGLDVPGTFVRLGGCFCWYLSFIKVFRLSPSGRKLTPEMAASVRSWKLTRRQKVLLVLVPVLAVLVPLISEVIR